MSALTIHTKVEGTEQATEQIKKVIEAMHTLEKEVKILNNMQVKFSIYSTTEE